MTKLRRLLACASDVVLAALLERAIENHAPEPLEDDRFVCVPCGSFWPCASWDRLAVEAERIRARQLSAG